MEEEVGTNHPIIEALKENYRAVEDARLVAENWKTEAARARKEQANLVEKQNLLLKQNEILKNELITVKETCKELKIKLDDIAKEKENNGELDHTESIQKQRDLIRRNEYLTLEVRSLCKELENRDIELKSIVKEITELKNKVKTNSSIISTLKENAKHDSDTIEDLKKEMSRRTRSAGEKLTNYEKDIRTLTERQESIKNLQCHVNELEVDLQRSKKDSDDAQKQLIKRIYVEDQVKEYLRSRLAETEQALRKSIQTHAILSKTSTEDTNADDLIKQAESQKIESELKKSQLEDDLDRRQRELQNDCHSMSDALQDKETMEKLSVEDFITEQLLLLETEKQAVFQREKEEMKQNGRTVCIEILHLSSPEYGGTLIKFQKIRNSHKKYPKFKERENVALKLGNNSKSLKGILVSQYTIHVNKNKEIFKSNRRWNLIKQTSTFQQFKDIETALKMISTNQSPLRDVLFGLRKSNLQDKLFLPEIFNKSLDRTQTLAVDSSLNKSSLAIVHGPPGTGKTTTLVEIILQSVKRGEKLLVTSATNIALDNLGEKLLKEGVQFIRLGHPARATENILSSSLTVMVKEKENELKEVMTDDGKLMLKYSKFSHKIVTDLLTESKVVLTTLSGCRAKGPLDNLPRDFFNTTIIDECGQALEMSSWMAIHRSPKLILAGDYLQLPPTVMSKRAEKKLSISLMERLRSLFSYNSLTIQYRMNSLIMNWSSTNFYNSSLQADSSVKNHKLSDLPGVYCDEVTNSVLKLIDTSGLDGTEISNDYKQPKSFANKEEAVLVIEYIEKLILKGITPIQIAVITPYNYQVELLKLNLQHHPDLEIRSVDGFQGKEKEVVILSMVRANESKNLGFLIEKRRLNVAVTRARRQLVLICNSRTLSKDEFLNSFIQYVKDNGEVDATTTVDTSNLLLPTRKC